MLLTFRRVRDRFILDVVKISLAQSRLGNTILLPRRCGVFFRRSPITALLSPRMFRVGHRRCRAVAGDWNGRGRSALDFGCPAY
jgi:hypothetical protein